MEKIIKGRIRIVKDNDVNTDVIFPGKYTYELMTPEEMGKHALEDFETDYYKKLDKGDFIISGRNFGCGSSREQAVTCFTGLNIGGIIAKSFSRLYFRNSINKALLAIENPKVVDYVFENADELEGEEIEVNTETGEIKIKDKVFTFVPLTGCAMDIFKAGGLVEYTKMKLGIK